jgi:hypothetical protein
MANLIENKKNKYAEAMTNHELIILVCMELDEEGRIHIESG